MTFVQVADAVDESVADFVRLDRPDAPVPAGPSYFHDLGRAGHAICAALFEAEDEGHAHDALVRRVEPARRMYARAPFVARLQEWPRGYPGDFETIECLWQAQAGGRDATSWCLDRQALTSPIAQQHRNKVFEQARRLSEVASMGRARALVLACGSSPDVRAARLTATDLDRLELTLTDADPAALAFSRQVLGPLAERCQFVHADALRALRRASGAFDLIMAGGLFDYLSARMCRRIVELAVARLAPGGLFFFTNIGAGNPYRTWIEYLGDWRLMERTDDEISALGDGLPGIDLSLERDATGLAQLVSIRKRE